MLLSDISVACVDVGSISQQRLAWAIGHMAQEVKTGRDIEILAQILVDRLEAGAPLALGFECPLFIPVSMEPLNLLKARGGEYNRPWSAAAGLGSLAIGLVQVPWLLRRIRSSLSREVPVSLELGQFKEHGGLLLWEAFVTGQAKGITHEDDARIAVESFGAVFSDETWHSTIDGSGPILSLAGAALLWVGWTSEVSLLRKPTMVVEARKT